MKPQSYLTFQAIAVIVLIILIAVSPSLISTTTITGLIILFIDEAILVILALYAIFKL